MSAPHCPATVLVVRPGAAQAERLAERLRTRRVAAVYASPMPSARQTGAILADRLGVQCTDLTGVEELQAALAEVADQHRGETVVVVSHEDAMTSAVPGAPWPPHRDFAELSIGPDGWELVHGPGTGGRSPRADRLP